MWVPSMALGVTVVRFQTLLSMAFKEVLTSGSTL